MPATVEDGKVKLTEGSVTDKAHALCRNAGIVLEAAGSSLEKVVKVTVGFAIERERGVDLIATGNRSSSPILMILPSSTRCMPSTFRRNRHAASLKQGDYRWA